MVKVAYYSFPKKKIKVLESVKLKQREVSSKVLVTAIDLFSLYILFSHFRPRDVTLRKTFFQMSSYAREYVRITYEKTKGTFP